MRYVYWIIVIGACMSLSPGKSIPKDLREWDRWAAAQVAVPQNDVKTFTPTDFVGFSAPPTDDLYYADLGALALIWTPVPFLGTSDATTFQFEGVPEHIRPADDASIPIGVYDNGNIVLGRVTITDAGLVAINKAVVSGTEVRLFGGSFTTSGSKGLLEGTFILYPK